MSVWGEEKGYSQVSGRRTPSKPLTTTKNMPAPAIPCSQSTWQPKKKSRVVKLTIPRNVTIVGKKWKKLDPNPLLAWRMCQKRTKFQHQLRIARYKSWTQESYLFLQIEDKKPEKVEIDLTSEPDNVQIALSIGTMV